MSPRPITYHITQFLKGTVYQQISGQCLMLPQRDSVGSLWMIVCLQVPVWFPTWLPSWYVSIDWKWLWLWSSQRPFYKLDKDVHRFLWDEHGTTRVMRFRRIPFGHKASSFLLNATIQHHRSSLPPSAVVQELKEKLYVDDLLSGADTDAKACDIMVGAGMAWTRLVQTVVRWLTWFCRSLIINILIVMCWP